VRRTPLGPTPAHAAIDRFNIAFGHARCTGNTAQSSLYFFDAILLLVRKLTIFARGDAFGINRIGGLERSVITVHRPDKGGGDFSLIHQVRR
jgi:hypothetical protein